MARVRCVTMQRDEQTLLEPWLRYVGYLFGYENILVFDNGSVSTSVTETLRFHEKLGVEVRWAQSHRDDYFNRGAHFENIIRHWDQAGDYDFVLPLDCDEFPAVFTPDGISCRRHDIHAGLDRLKGTRRTLGFDISLDNVPGRTGWFSASPRPKNFLAAGTLGATGTIDFHNQAIRTAEDDGVEPTSLVYLHHRHRPLDEARRLACHKLGIAPEPTALAALSSHADPLVVAYAATLADASAQQAGFDARIQIQVPALGLLLRGLGCDAPALGADATSIAATSDATGAGSTLQLPPDDARGSPHVILFDAATYRALHPDLATDGVLSLKHYLVYGHAEQRTIDLAPPPVDIIAFPEDHAPRHAESREVHRLKNAKSKTRNRRNNPGGKVRAAANPAASTPGAAI